MANAPVPSYLGQQYAEQHAGHDAVVVQKPNQHCVCASADVYNMLNTQALQDNRADVQTGICTSIWHSNRWQFKFQGGEFDPPSTAFSPLNLTQTSSLILLPAFKWFHIWTSYSIFWVVFFSHESHPIVILDHSGSRGASLALIPAPKLKVQQRKDTNCGPTDLQQTLNGAGTRGFQPQPCKLCGTITPAHNTEQHLRLQRVLSRWMAWS